MLDNWLFLNHIDTDSEDNLQYVFTALGTKALELHAQWTPLGTLLEQNATKTKATAFLKRIKDGMTHKVKTHVWLAKLEDITMKPDEDPQELVACIKTIMDRCKMLNDEHQEHELCHRIVWAYRNDTQLLDKLMVKSFKTPLSKLIDIAINHFGIQRACNQVSNTSKTVEAICLDKHWSSRGRGGHGHTQPSYPDCGNCTKCHQPGRGHCPAKESKCSKCNRTGHWTPKCLSGKPALKTSNQQRGHHGTWCGTSRQYPESSKMTDTIDIDVGKDDSPRMKSHSMESQSILTPLLEMTQMK